jgi:hypothetical protein
MLAEQPICSCGLPMVPIADHPELYTCAHCDGPCHQRCKDESDCENGNGKCVHCNAFDIGSRRKRDDRWQPPK